MWFYCSPLALNIFIDFFSHHNCASKAVCVSIRELNAMRVGGSEWEKKVFPSIHFILKLSFVEEQHLVDMIRLPQISVIKNLSHVELCMRICVLYMLKYRLFLFLSSMILIFLLKTKKKVEDEEEEGNNVRAASERENKEKLFCCRAQKKEENFHIMRHHNGPTRATWLCIVTCAVVLSSTFRLSEYSTQKKEL